MISNETTWDLGESNMGPYECEVLAECLKDNVTLVNLYLGDNHIGPLGAKVLAQALENNVKLKHLFLSGNDLGDDGAAHIGQLLLNNSCGLISLNLGINGIGPEGAVQLGTSLRSNTKLSKLNLYHNRIALGDQQQGICALADSLAINTTLRSLNLNYNSIGSAGASALAKAIELGSSLTSLSVSSNGIKEPGSVELARSLSNNTSLKSLDLGNNQIGICAETELANSLSRNGTLTYLDISYNLVQTSGLVALSKSLKGNSTLRTFDISHNTFDISHQEIVKPLTDLLELNSTIISYGTNTTNNERWIPLFLFHSELSKTHDEYSQVVLAKLFNVYFSTKGVDVSVFSLNALRVAMEAVKGNMSGFFDCLKTNILIATESKIVAGWTKMYVGDLIFKHNECAQQAICILATLRDLLSSNKDLRNVNIHVVGDAKAGKSVAIRWMASYLARGKVVSDKLYTKRTERDVIYGRTRGVEITQFTANGTNYRIHDYGGQEEFMMNHANYMGIEQSIYVVVVPGYEVETNETGRTRSTEEIKLGYAKWLKYIYSLVKKSPFENLAEVESNQQTVQRADNLCGIPLLTIVNKFCRKGVDIQYTDLSEQLLGVLNATFHCKKISTPIVEGAEYDFLLPDVPIVLSENDTKHEMETVWGPLTSLVAYCAATTQPYSVGSFVLAAIEDIMPKNPLFLSQSTWAKLLTEWLQDLIQTKFAATSKPIIDHYMKTFIEVLREYVHNTLINMGYISTFSPPVAGLEILTNPTLLSSVVLGDLMFWYTKHGPIEKLLQSSEKNELMLSHRDIVEKLEWVDSFYKSANVKNTTEPFVIKTAVDVLAGMGGAEVFPIGEMLQNVGLAINAGGYNLMIGLIPSNSKSKESNLSNCPYKLLRYFKLPSKKYGFIPGYFLRLFTFLSKLEPQMSMNCWGDGVNFQNVDVHGNVIEQIIIDYHPFGDADGFMVTFGTASADAELRLQLIHKFETVRAFLHRHMWGVYLEEHCVHPATNEIRYESIAITESKLLGICDSKDIEGKSKSRGDAWKFYFGGLIETNAVATKIMFDIMDLSIQDHLKESQESYQMLVDGCNSIEDVILVLKQLAANKVEVEVEIIRSKLYNALRIFYMRLNNDQAANSNTNIAVNGLFLSEFDRLVILLTSNSHDVVTGNWTGHVNNSNFVEIPRTESRVRDLYAISKANKVFAAPLFFRVEDIDFQHQSKRLPGMQIFNKNYWKKKVGCCYRLKYMCQLCGKVPDGCKGYKIHILYDWAIKTLQIVAVSLQLLEFALKVAGMPNGISAIGDAALNVFGGQNGLQHMVQSCLETSETITSHLKSLNISDEFLASSRESLQHLIQKGCDPKMWVDPMNAKVKIDDDQLLESCATLSLQDVLDLRAVFENVQSLKPNQPQYHGLTCITREGYDCAWVCAKGGCVNKFWDTGRLLIRYKIKTPSNQDA